MLVAGTLRRFPRHQVVHALVGDRADHHVQHADIDIVAQARLAAARQRGQHRHRGVHAGHQVDDGHAHFLRAAAGQVVALARHAHQAAHGLDHEVVGGVVRLRAILAKAGDGAVDQARVDFFQAGVIEAELGQGAHLVVLQQDVRLQRQRAHDLLAFAGIEVDRDGALAAVGGQVVARFARLVAVLVFQERRAPAARVVADFRPFDLDHVGAEIGQDLARPRAGQDAAQIEHFDMG